MYWSSTITEDTILQLTLGYHLYIVTDQLKERRLLISKAASDLDVEIQDNINMGPVCYHTTPSTAWLSWHIRLQRGYATDVGLFLHASGIYRTATD